MNLYLLLFIIIGVLIVCFLIYKKTKHLKLDNVTMITGGVKVGKTTLGIYLAYKTYKKVHRLWTIKSFFKKIFKKPLDEEPLFYSNIPVTFPYSPVTTDLIERKKRFNYKSVIFVSESSLLIDSQYINNSEVNERTMLFNKLIGHETRGGYLFYETQAILDNHYSVKRCLNNYIWINKSIKVFPLFICYQVRELKFNGDSSTMNIFIKDNEEETKLLLVPKKVWKLFDCYTYSSFTDDLEISNELITTNNLKSNSIVSFKKYKTLEKEKINNEKNKKDI